MAGSTPFRTQAQANRFRNALRNVMVMAAPIEADRQATFYFAPEVSVSGGGEVDAEGTPFAPGTVVSRTPRPAVRVPVAIEYLPGSPNFTAVGEFESDRIVLTLLDHDYAKVVGPNTPSGAGFEFVVVGGTKYKFEKELLERALGSVGIHQLRCEAVD